jgi:hypothetical protein
MPRPSCTPALDTTNLPQNRPQAVGKVPNKSGEPHTPKGEDFHVGPHIMIVSPHEYQKELESFSHDGSNGIPDVAHLTNGNDSTNANSGDGAPAYGEGSDTTSSVLSAAREASTLTSPSVPL